MTACYGRRVATPDRRNVRYLVSGSLLGLALLAAWWKVPETLHVELRIVKEAMPPHAPLTAAWSNETGTRVLAVGAHGEVFERTSELGDGAGRWRSIGPGIEADLTAVAGSEDRPHENPWEPPAPVSRVVAVGLRGAVLDCSGAQCSRISTSVTKDLRAVAAAGGQAVVVGDGGTILHVRPNPQHFADRSVDALAIERVEVDVTNDLRFVAMRCVDETTRKCLAVAVGGAGTIVEGIGEGRCEDGSPHSRWTTNCAWVWSRRPSPTTLALVAVQVAESGTTALAVDGARLIRSSAGDWRVEAAEYPRATSLATPAPVHVVRTKLWRRHDESTDALVWLGADPHVQRRGQELTSLRVDLPVRIATATKGNELVYLLSDAGDLYLAR
jgi:hypothetical protein